MTRANPTELFLAKQLDVGWSAWERMPDDADYWPRGGIVTAIDDRADADTGEIVRWFETLHFPQGRPEWVWLSEHDVNAESIKLPNSASIRDAVKRLNELLGRARGTFTSDHVKWQDTAFRLMRAVG